MKEEAESRFLITAQMSKIMASMIPTSINDLPDAILSTVISLISDTRARNSASLVCHKWYQLERATRASLVLRGNMGHLFMLPGNCFTSVTHLNVSLISPYGHPFTSQLYASRLRVAFPSVTSLSFYARDSQTIELISPLWAGSIERLKLVRWHKRPQVDSPGDELKLLFSSINCVGENRLRSLDCSEFYCWTDDVAPALEAYPLVSSSLTCLNLLNPSFPEGFKSEEIKAITKLCPNLREFKAACMFDPRYMGFVGDEALVALSANCPLLRVLHLADTMALADPRGRFDDREEDAHINVVTLIEVFSGLSMLEDLVLDLCNKVKESSASLEALQEKCLNLKTLKLGQFWGISTPVESKLNGVALFHQLESLSIRNVDDLDNMGLIAIARGCSGLRKFEISGCDKVTMRGMRTLTSLLRRSLVEVSISCCKNFNAVSSLRALEPIQARIERLHIDCVWDRGQESEDFLEIGSDLNVCYFDRGETSNGSQCIEYQSDSSTFDYNDLNCNNTNKRLRYSYNLNSSVNNRHGHENGNGGGGCHNGLNGSWERLKHLSLWIPVGQLLNPLTSSGLEDCPNLEEIVIKVEGDCRELSKPSQVEFGLSTLSNYPNLSKMKLDCGEAIGYAHTAPSGQMDLSLWERFYLYGVEHLGLSEIDYWPPHDRDVNRRSISLPAAGLLQQCHGLRKLFIHGTAHEHFMRFLLQIVDLRDVQLREDYYPAPEDDMSTEMREDSCSRFETALNMRQIPD